MEEKLFSAEEINELREKSNLEDLKKFFLDIFLKKGDSEEDAQERAQTWAEKIIESKID